MIKLVIITIALLSFVNIFNFFVKKYGSEMLKKLGFSKAQIDFDISIRSVAFPSMKLLCYLLILLGLLYKFIGVYYVPNYDKGLVVGIIVPVYCLLLAFFAFLDIADRYLGNFCKKMSDSIELFINRAVAYLIILTISFLLVNVFQF